MKRNIVILYILGIVSLLSAQALASQLMYIVNTGNQAIVAFNTTDNGNVAPTVNIIGAATTLSSPTGVAEDSSLNIWASCTSTSLCRFSAGANGNATPDVVISGPSTTLGNPRGVWLDSSNNIWTANQNTGKAIRFPAASSGDAAPTVLTTNTVGAGITLDPATGNLYGIGGNTIYEWDAPIANGAAPTHSISGGNTTLNGPNGVALDSSANIWVTNSGANSVLEFTAANWGNVAPAVTIVGAGTGLSDPRGIGIDGSGTIYIANRTASIFGSVTSYAAGSSGNASPSTTIAGASTTFSNPQLLFLEPTPTPTATPAATATPEPTNTPEPTATETPGPTPVPATEHCDNSLAPPRKGYIGCSP